MTRIITIISGKGGVGKTTTVTNLGMALIDQGENVIVIDGNITTPNLSLHLGIPFYPITLNDVMKKRFPIDSALYDHHSGLKILPASLSADSLEGVDLRKMEYVLLNLLGKADIILIDAAAGLGSEAKIAIDVADELIIVTNPELPAVTDALRTINIAKSQGTKVLGVVVNRRTGRSHEMKDSEIKNMLEVPILKTISEHRVVPISISNKTPVVRHSPRSKVAKQYVGLAEDILGYKSRTKPRNKNWVDRFLSWLV